MSIRTTDIKSALDDLAVSWQGWKTKYDARQAELLDRVEELESWRSSPGKTWTKPEGREHTEKFLKWLRRPHDHAVRAALAEAESAIMQKAVTIGTPSAGGYTVPEEISRDIESRARA